MIAPKDRAPVWFAAFAAQMAQRLQAELAHCFAKATCKVAQS